MYVATVQEVSVYVLYYDLNLAYRERYKTKAIPVDCDLVSHASDAKLNLNENLIHTAGATGMQGPLGEEGHMGVRGGEGLKGNQGMRGAKGENGDEGQYGAPGLNIYGPRGDFGAMGPPGYVGHSGINYCHFFKICQLL